MKRSAVLVLIIFLFCHLGYTQKNRFGILGGANYSKWRGDFEEGGVVLGGRFAYNFGVFGEFVLNDVVSLSPRIKYSSQGYISDFFLLDNP